MYIIYRGLCLLDSFRLLFMISQCSDSRVPLWPLLQFVMHELIKSLTNRGRDLHALRLHSFLVHIRGILIRHLIAFPRRVECNESRDADAVEELGGASCRQRWAVGNALPLIADRTAERPRPYAASSASSRFPRRPPWDQRRSGHGVFRYTVEDGDRK